ncbi:MAG: ribosomal-processing cysteine protease Prp [Pigeon pea little leaf phytoplasma]|uniref:Ribosomal processing cysteine protease Prp n=1 Tax=Candidatus Phytoplasma fabacearum TaxID=2982628 RepID=A0ABU8ZSQ1_9MOLU|nr:ribosomal-processing cysteine protease Prp ['Bituminaria bituminosa' little leaf phytoplasma]MDV3148659.1 ribosomal-processing cysteine protease Prp [Pigeon pea little leaf phytoplasma]MDO7983442.1 ribosomal-processing cysteine protease Prp ['Bituminaria bituminosa' little leaf phytoplasma]MDO8023823.1 ribosomal-processing cysteine protease Prp ['Bituminaria bituminosa' little leaf phytoplasma]MDO8030569.1 ribosomal-processing cysteine protease Prp ['Bituminaria bituminosa' little leaf phyto
MIECFIKYNNDNIISILIQGHAQYSGSNDIVCSSVSTAIIVTVNAIELLNLKNKISFKLKKGYFKLILLKSNLIVNKLLQNLKYTLKDLSQQYQTCLKVKLIKNTN